MDRAVESDGINGYSLLGVKFLFILMYQIKDQLEAFHLAGSALRLLCCSGTTIELSILNSTSQNMCLTANTSICSKNVESHVDHILPLSTIHTVTMLFLFTLLASQSVTTGHMCCLHCSLENRTFCHFSKRPQAGVVG